MPLISNVISKYTEAVLLRIMMFLFIFLTLEFSRMFISASAGTNPYMAMWSDILFEATVIIVFDLLFSDSAIGRDVNTLNFLALICHLLYLPCYYFGYQFASYHNYAILTLEAIFCLRLFYFGKQEIFSKISILSHTKKWLAKSKEPANIYVNKLTIGLFLLCGLPLFALIYMINTDQMRASGVAIILLVFFIAFDYSNKKNQIKSVAVEENATEKNRSIVSKTTHDAESNSVDEKIEALNRVITWLVLGMAALMAICAFSLYTEKKAMFEFGYASGYTDSKAGNKPQSETSFDKVFVCHNRDWRTPPNKNCPAK